MEVVMLVIPCNLVTFAVAAWGHTPLTSTNMIGDFAQARPAGGVQRENYHQSNFDAIVI
jgi:hypothetical protein